MRKFLVLIFVLSAGLEAGAQYAARPWPPGASSTALSTTTPSSQTLLTATPQTSGSPIVYEGLKAKEPKSPASNSAAKPPPQMPQFPGLGSGVGGGTRTPAGSDSLAALGQIQSCEGNVPDQTALETALECANAKLSSASNDKLGLADTEGKIMFIIDRNTKKPVGCVQISTGSGGTGSGKGQTPRGMLITGEHHGEKYQSDADGTNHDCIGLQGTDSETKVRADNGVVIHPAHGGAGGNTTAGCIGIEDSSFAAVKALLYGSDSAPKRSAVFVFDHNTREKCAGSSVGGGSGSDEQDSGATN